MHDSSVDSLSLESMASAAPGLYNKHSKGSKWSNAKPEPLSTVVPPTTQDQSSNIVTVEMANKATKYNTPYPKHYINHGFEQDLFFPFNSAPEARVPHPPQPSSTTAQVSSVQAGSSSTSLQEAAIVTNQPSSSPVEATAATNNQLDVILSVKQDVDQGVAQQPLSTITQKLISADQPRDDQPSSQIETINEQT